MDALRSPTQTLHCRHANNERRCAECLPAWRSGAHTSPQVRIPSGWRATEATFP